jgi:hypothetical protein
LLVKAAGGKCLVSAGGKCVGYQEAIFKLAESHASATL